MKKSCNVSHLKKCQEHELLTCCGPLMWRGNKLTLTPNDANPMPQFKADIVECVREFY